MGEEGHLEAFDPQLVGRLERNLVHPVVAIEVRTSVRPVAVEGKRAAQTDIHRPVLVAEDAVLGIEEGRIAVVALQIQVAARKDRRPAHAQRHLEKRIEVVGHAQVEKVAGRILVVVEDVLAVGQVGRVVVDVPHGDREAGNGIRGVVVELLVVAREVRAAPQSDLEAVVEEADIEIGGEHASVGDLQSAPEVHVLQGTAEVDLLSVGCAADQQCNRRSNQDFQSFHGHKGQQ